VKINNRLLGPDDENAVTACADLVGRSGAKQFQIGYLHDDVPSEKAGWYAIAYYVGGRIAAADQPSPTRAATELARKILTGAKCRCGRLVALSEDGAIAFDDPVMTDGSSWTLEKAAAAGQCLWRLTDRTWTPSCPEPDDRQKASGS
jgi:hypothetical protein